MFYLSLVPKIFLKFFIEIEGAIILQCFRDISLSRFWFYLKPFLSTFGIFVQGELWLLNWS